MTTWYICVAEGHAIQTYELLNCNIIHSMCYFLIWICSIEQFQTPLGYSKLCNKRQRDKETRERERERELTLVLGKKSGSADNLDIISANIMP